ncbi:MAG TPA: adenylosuccinate synthetase [Candidatus Nitrosocosmicus sp.]|nr:adenylosuccinate synthetase [Candidatus Nitrosocosmicus sp.]
MSKIETSVFTNKVQAIRNLENRMHSPLSYLQEDYEAVYKREEIQIGNPDLAQYFFDEMARKNTVCIVGAQFGDEGKGRFVDNKLQEILGREGVKKAYVVRYQGGSNAGHTVYSPEGVKLPLHQVPSSVFEARAVGIMDTGMIINMEDLRTEIEDSEKLVGDLRGRLILSNDAILNTDLERAMEVLNVLKTGGKSEGGTRRGISPSYANKLLRYHLTIASLFDANWREELGKRYDALEKEFNLFSTKPLSEQIVPDLRAIRNQDTTVRTVGDKKTYLDRLEAVREWFLSRDNDQPIENQLRQNTFLLHHAIKNDVSNGLLFEGSQAIGLHKDIGRLPDVTASDTSVYGITAGTSLYRADDVEEKIGVFKLTYMSSVGSAKMLTAIDIPREAVETTDGYDDDQLYGLKVREVAQEKGTTTGRYRDICFLDLALMRYNILMGGIESLAGTHADLAWENQPVKVCTHYTNEKGDVVPYQPGIQYQEGLTPHYIELPGWSGDEVRNATSMEDLPLNAKKFFSFVQRQLGVPIIALTTGPERHHLLNTTYYDN